MANKNISHKQIAIKLVFETCIITVVKRKQSTFIYNKDLCATCAQHGKAKLWVNYFTANRNNGVKASNSIVIRARVTNKVGVLSCFTTWFKFAYEIDLFSLSVNYV